MIIYFICRQESEGFSAKAEGFPIFTQGDDYAELNKNIREAIELHFGRSYLYYILIV